MPYIERPGARTHYEVTGKGPVILLSHGYSATAGMWSGNAPALSRDHTLVTWDMRGHGDSDSPDDTSLYSEDATLGDMNAILDAVGADRAVIGGLSLGGFMSLAFHRSFPERVRALLIIATGPGFRKDEAREEWNRYAEATAQKLEAKGLDYLQRLTPEMATSRHRGAQGLVKAARGMLTQRDASVIDSLPTIAVPALIVVGANDKGFLNAADYMAAKIPGARRVTIPDAGHAVNIDQREAFDKAVTEFLAGLS
jgi:pimeloyl-ACP methyl ester carboxylesterase